MAEIQVLEPHVDLYARPYQLTNPSHEGSRGYVYLITGSLKYVTPELAPSYATYIGPPVLVYSGPGLRYELEVEVD